MGIFDFKTDAPQNVFVFEMFDETINRYRFSNIHFQFLSTKPIETLNKHVPQFDKNANQHSQSKALSNILLINRRIIGQIV